MLSALFHALAGNPPLPRLKVDLSPHCAAGFAGSRGRQDQEPEAEFPPEPSTVVSAAATS